MLGSNTENLRTQKIRLGDSLLEQGLLTQDQLERALAEQKTSGKKLGRVLVDLRLLTERKIAEAIARQLRLNFIDLGSYPLDPKTVQKLSEVQARRFRAIILKKTSDGYQVGMVEPTDFSAIDDISRALNAHLEIAIVTETELLSAIDRAYRKTDEIIGLAKEVRGELDEGGVEFGELMGTLGTSVDDAPIVKLLHTVFDEAVRLRASDIHIEPQERTLKIRFRIDGVLHLQNEVDVKIAQALALRLKLMSSLDISEKRLPQDGRFNVRLRGGMVDVRLSSMPTQYGESIVMRLLVQESGVLSLESLHLPERLESRLRKTMSRSSGMILVTGPTGSGKTTTLYGVLGALNNNDRKIITVEDPVEYRMPGLNQVQISEKIDLTFAKVLRSSLRQDPDVILVGEMRDQETAEIGMRAAMTGHMVLSTLHTNDAASTPARLLDMGVPGYLVAMSLNMVIAQRLVRRVCTRCKQEYDPDEQEKVWLQQLHPGLGYGKLYRGAGCESCNHTGFSGRIGVYEFLEITTELSDLLSHQDHRAFTRLARQQLDGQTFVQHALRQALAGTTTLSEVIRIADSTIDISES